MLFTKLKVAGNCGFFLFLKIRDIEYQRIKNDLKRILLYVFMEIKCGIYFRINYIAKN